MAPYLPATTPTPTLTDSSTPSTSSTPSSRAATSAAPRRLNALRHGLTGQVFLLSEDDARNYHKHNVDIRKHYQPVGPIEEALTDQIATGIWRLHRCAAMEEATFAFDSVPHTEFENEPIHGLIGPARTWATQSKSLHLLSLYEGRIRRALDKDKAELAALQQQRNEEATHALNQAVALYKLAKKEGRPYQPDRYFTRTQPTADFVFSPDLIAAESARRDAWSDAQTRLKSFAA